MPLRRCGDVPERSSLLPSHRSDHCPPAGPTPRCGSIREAAAWGAAEGIDRGPGREPHVILGLQVPGLLAQEAEDIGEVLVPNLIKHLLGECGSNR